MFKLSRLMCACALVCAAGCLPEGERTDENNGGGGEGDAPIVVVSRDGDLIAANASITITAGTRVALDASGSSDPDGDALSFAWTLTSPDGDAIATGDAPAFDHTFDVLGDFVIALEVSDGVNDATGRVAVSVRATLENQPPAADAGPDASAAPGGTFSLDGSGSSDPDGDALAYAWSITSAPAGSTATLSDAASVAPTLTPDLVGAYTVTLTVDDGRGATGSDEVVLTISDAPNAAPTADAGADQTVTLGSTLTLDGTGSSDPDGDTLTFSWVLDDAPAGSNAALSDAAASAPTFTPALAGTYRLTLTVDDGRGGSDSDEVILTLEGGDNAAPVAVAGADQIIRADATASVDASASTDADGDLLGFAWTVAAAPAGSTAASFGDATAAATTFSPDVPGDFDLRVEVSDGQGGVSSDNVLITVNAPPVADAGPDAFAGVGDLVTLDGTGSSDPESDALAFAWTLTTRPAGSSAALSSGDAARPTFTADVSGAYVAQLILTDALGNDSAPDSVTITTAAPPTADAGSDRTVTPGSSVTLDGTGSSDPDGDPLTFSWAITSRPAGSSAAFSNTALAQPTFVADVTGLYVVSLTVTDAQSYTHTDTVEVFATSEQCPSGVIISEYVEGTGNNKALEFYNCTSVATIALANYGLCRYSNGTPVCTSIDLGGLKPTLAPGETFTLCNGSSSAALLPLCDATNNNISHTGNDTYILFLDLDGDDDYSSSVDDVVDVFGQLARFSDFAMDQTYDRCDFRPYDGSNVFDPSMSYVARGVDEFSGLGVAPTESCYVANRDPVALAGPDDVVLAGSTVTLDGRSSFDPDGDALTYLWTITSRPAGSSASVSNTSSSQPSYVADLAGLYEIALTVTDTANNTSLVDVVAIEARATLFSPNCSSGLFFSEYVEGTSNNKAIEIYNCGAVAVDMDDYQICATINDSSTTCEALIDFTPGLVLPPNGYHVMCNSLFPGGCDQTSSAITFTGNDRLGILHVSTNTIVDAIGLLIDLAPVNFAKEVTLERCDYIAADGTTAFDPAQWASLPADTLSNLGRGSQSCP